MAEEEDTVSVGQFELRDSNGIFEVFDTENQLIVLRADHSGIEDAQGRRTNDLDILNADIRTVERNIKSDVNTR